MTVQDLISDPLLFGSSNISISQIILNIVIVTILVYCIRFVYVKFGRSISNRIEFSKNFLLVTLATMFIITIVKSSLALSLGLVGALSIIRFRSAIKEPEELCYLFLSISVGLGIGADQILATIVSALVILLAVIIFSLRKDKLKNYNMMLTISGQYTKRVDQEIIEIVKRTTKNVGIKRHETAEGQITMVFIVELNAVSDLVELRNRILNVDKNFQISFIDNKGILQ